MTGPPYVPGDAAIADLKLVLRGVHLPLDLLGGHVDRSAAPQSLASVRLGVPAPARDAVGADGVLVVADEESKPIASLAVAGVTTGQDANDPAVATGPVQPVDPHSWPPLGGPGAPTPTTVVVVRRPLLRADVPRLADLAGGGDLVVAVPVAGPSPDGVPAGLLTRLVTGVAAQVGARVVPVDIAWRHPATDEALADAVAAALGVPAATPCTDGDGDWADLLRALDGEQPLPEVADEGALQVLRRWRPPLVRRGLVILLTGLSGAGKSTLARALAAHVQDTSGRTVSLLDGDRVRRLLSSGLGFDRASRDLNVRRIGFVAAEVARHGGVAVCAPIAPYAQSRAAVRAMAREVGDFVLVHVHAPLEEVERRDVKGLYARARAGLVESFTGVSDPYEEPTDADLTLDTSVLSEGEALDLLVNLLESRGWVTRTRGEDG